MTPYRLRAYDGSVTDTERKGITMKRDSVVLGQVYYLRHAKIGQKLVKVIKINPKNVKAQTESGTIYNAHPSFLYEASPIDRAAYGKGGTTSTPSPSPIPFKALYYGQVVKFNNGRHKGLFVVIGQHNDKYRVAALGGDSGRYLRNVTTSMVDVVDFELAGV